MLSCPDRLCSECRELDTLDAQIADAHNALANLSQKRHKLKERINRRHDALTSRLPLEIISYIFKLIVDEPRFHKSLRNSPWNAVVHIGAVCKRWRDITLGMPQLWTNVFINPWKHVVSLEITEQWISRSFSLPLSLVVDSSYDIHPSSGLPPNISDLVQLLRSQATRWKELTLNCSEQMLRSLLNGMECRAPVDSLEISLEDDFIVGTDNITMEHPFVPKTLDISYIALPLIPVHWGRLTHLTTCGIEVDNLLYIFRSAPNLRDCNLAIGPWSGETIHYPIPVSPSINDSVLCLDARWTGYVSRTTHFFQHLTLPSLETLSYNVTHTVDGEELDALIDFFDRSKPPLHDFTFSFDDVRHAAPPDIEWYQSLSSITALNLVIGVDDRGERLQAYIQGLNVDLVPMALPCLQYIKIHASKINLQTWDALTLIFPNRNNKDDTGVDADNALPAVSRPLDTVKIYTEFNWEHRINMSISTFYRLRSVRESGVRFMVFDKDQTDLLDPLLEEDCLTFCESDDDDMDEFEDPSQSGGSEEEWV